MPVFLWIVGLVSMLFYNYYANGIYLEFSLLQ